MIKRTALLGVCALFAANIAIADEEFTSLADVDAVALDSAEMASIEGKAHGGFPLGALLIDVANAALFATPAWTDRGLHPFNGPALGKAQVPARD